MEKLERCHHPEKIRKLATESQGQGKSTVEVSLKSSRSGESIPRPSHYSLGFCYWGNYLLSINFF